MFGFNRRIRWLDARIYQNNNFFLLTCFMNLLLWGFLGSLLYVLLAVVKLVSLWFLLTAIESSHKIEQWSTNWQNH